MLLHTNYIQCMHECNIHYLLHVQLTFDTYKPQLMHTYLHGSLISTQSTINHLHGYMAVLV